MIAELRLDRPLDLPRRHAKQRIRERLDEAATLRVPEIPAVVRRARVLRVLLRQRAEILARLELREHLLRLRQGCGVVLAGDRICRAWRFSGTSRRLFSLSYAACRSASLTDCSPRAHRGAAPRTAGRSDSAVMYCALMGLVVGLHGRIVDLGGRAWTDPPAARGSAPRAAGPRSAVDARQLARGEEIRAADPALELQALQRRCAARFSKISSGMPACASAAARGLAGNTGPRPGRPARSVPPRAASAWLTR